MPRTDAPRRMQIDDTTGPNSDDIVPEWQDLEVGDVVHADRARTAGWYVVELRPNEALVLQVGDLAAGRPLRRDEKLRWEFLWTFALRDAPDGSTRLLVRERVAVDRTMTRALLAPVGIASFVMTRGMLRGIKARVEARRERSRIATPTRPPAARRRRERLAVGTAGHARRLRPTRDRSFR